MCALCTKFGGSAGLQPGCADSGSAVRHGGRKRRRSEAELQLSPLFNVITGMGATSTN